MDTNKSTIKLYLALSLLLLVVMMLVGCGTLEVGAVSADAVPASNGDAGDAEVKGIEIGIEPTPMPETLTYTNDFYGFKFTYPETWALSEEDHRVILMKGTNRLGINFRWAGEQIDHFGRTGMGAGDFIYAGKVNFMNQVTPAEALLFEKKTKAVFYGESGLVETGDLVFVIALEDLETDYTDVDLSDEIITEAGTILESFERIEASGSPPDDAPKSGLDGSPPASTMVVAWLGHIASLPEGSRFDDMLVLAPEGTGELGLIGSTPEIEAEIQSLRDAKGPDEYVHLWGVLSCGVEDYNNCQLSVDRLQYGANFSEEDIHDWFGTIKTSTFNGGQSYVFELLGYYPMWYSINASQNETLKAQIEHFLQTGEVVEVSGKLMVGVPDVNGTRIEISSIEARSPSGMPRPDIVGGPVYENREYGFKFLYPSHMSVEEEPNRVFVNNGTLQLTIAYRRADENINISDIGELTGEFHPYTDVLFLGQSVQPSLNINDGRITAVYLGGPGVELGEDTPLRFVVSMINTDGTWISNAQVDEMLQIFHDFELE